MAIDQLRSRTEADQCIEAVIAKVRNAPFEDARRLHDTLVGPNLA